MQIKMNGEGKMSIKQKAVEVTTTTKRVITNGETFIQAVSLLTVAAFSYWSLHQIKVAEPLQWVVTAALVIIGLRGFYEFVKFLDK